VSPMRLLAVLAVLAMAASGCIRAPAEPLEPTTLPETPAPVAEALEPVMHTWDGLVTASQLGMLAHNRDTELLVADVQREGFVFEVTEVPQDFRTELTWTANGPTPAEMLVMVSSPKDANNEGVEYFTELAAEGPLCLRIPADGIVPGLWQVMAHTRMATQVEFTFTITTLGGMASILEGEPHSSAEAATTTDGEALPCEEPAPEA
jgi:hypothetical protein